MTAQARLLPLRRSLQASEALASQASATEDPALKRLLLKSSCDLLFHSLDAAPSTTPLPGRDSQR
jgi:hypothetical protein